MSKVRLHPHLVSRAERVSVEPWFRRAGSDIQLLNSEVTDWTVGGDLHLVCEANVDVEGVLADTGLHTDAVLGVFALLDCRASHLRRSATLPISLGNGHALLELRIESGQLCDQFDLSRGLVVVEPGSGSAPRAATTPGARLVECDAIRVALGDGRPKFPVETVDFRSLRLPSAAWIITVDAESPIDSFLGSVRLLLNVNHKSVQALTDGEPAEQQLIKSALRADTIRQLFASACQDPRFREGPFPEESLGSVMDAIATKELSMPLASALQLLASDPNQFDAELQARLRYLGGVV